MIQINNFLFFDVQDCVFIYNIYVCIENKASLGLSRGEAFMRILIYCYRIIILDLITILNKYANNIKK